jgi:hypothetical protein
MEDVNKGKRKTMWVIGIVFCICVPAFAIFDRPRVKEEDFATVNNLVLANDPQYISKNVTIPYIEFQFRGMRRNFRLMEEHDCVTDDDILTSLKKGDMVSIQLLKSDRKNFRLRNLGGGNAKIYGLSKGKQEYVSLACTNKNTTKSRKGGIIASVVAAILSFLFAGVILRPKKEFERMGILPADPVLIVIVCWLVLLLGLK